MSTNAEMYRDFIGLTVFHIFLNVILKYRNDTNNVEEDSYQLSRA